MMKHGNSIPWYQSVKVLTGTDRLDISGLLEYFKPLQNWLERNNIENNETIGWQSQ